MAFISLTFRPRPENLRHGTTYRVSPDCIPLLAPYLWVSTGTAPRQRSWGESSLEAAL